MGLNFAPVSTKFALQDTIASVEEVPRQLPKDDADDLRGGRVCGILRSAQLPKDNMKKEHRKALKEFRSLEDEVILPADKENATVVMKKSDYDRRMRGMSDDTATYRKLPHHHPGSQDRSYTTKITQG